MAVVMTTAAAEPMRKNNATRPVQREAFDRLRGEQHTATRKAADVDWERLSRAVKAALQVPDKTRDATTEELQAIFALLKPGENCNGWVNPYATDDPRSLLKQNQFESFHDQSQFIMDVQSRQTGKDYTLGGVAAEDCIKHALTEWTTAAPSERQSLESLAKQRVWIEAFGDVVDDYQETRDGPQALMRSACIVLPNGSKLRAVPGMPHTVRGLTSNVALTEGDFFEEPTETMRALFGSIANEERGQKKIRIITTPNGKNGITWKEFNKPDSIWSKRLITIWRAVCLGLKQNPYVLQKLFDGDVEGWAQEFLCQWLDDASVLLTYEMIASCESVDASEHDTPEMLAQSPLRKVAGIDFGRVNDPTVMSLALNGLGINIVRNVTRLKGMSTPDQVKTLKPYLDLCSRICVDYTGPGIGFGDELVKLYGQYKPESHEHMGRVELCTFTLPLKRILFPTLRKAFESRIIRIPVSSWYREDLHAMNMVINNGEYNYKAPRTDEGHSDGCTSLALCVRAAGSGLNGGGGRVIRGSETQDQPGFITRMAKVLNPFGNRA
jgi:phage FluMu gp28-like protein